jgi:membrane-associated phospholipid phosphatase
MPPEQMLTSWDRTLFIAINHHLRSPLLDFLMPRISDLGLGHIQVLALLIVAVVRGRAVFARQGSSLWPRIKATFGSQRRWLTPMLVAFALSGIGATIIKHYVERDRPYWFYTNDSVGRALNVKINTVASRPPMHTRGFLSGHTATSVALAATATVLLWRRRRRAPIVGIWSLAAIISLSRIYLADHWPIDVGAGAILGVICALAALRLCGQGVRMPARTPGRSDRDTIVSKGVAGSA